MATHGAFNSGTGVFYQAMPAVGADGRNVMKLIPVQRVNGQFVQSQTGTNKKDIAQPQTAFTMNLAAASTSKDNTLEPSANVQFVKKKLSYMNGLFTPVNVTGRYPEMSGLLNTSMQTQDPTATSKGTQSRVSMAPPVLNFGKSSTLLITKQLPVTVKSPVLPNGQYLQIPPNAQVKTLPASALPLAIKKQIFSSATTSSNLPTVVYVSPVTTMKQGGTQIYPKSSTVAFNNFPRFSDQTPSASVSSTQCPKPIDKVGQRPVSPIRWVIEQQDDSPDSHPCIVPVKSSSMTADILKTLAEMEKANKTCENECENPSFPQLSPTKTGKDNALVMCNGKVYFVAKTTPELWNRPSKPLEASKNMMCSSTQATVDSGGLRQWSSSSRQPHIVIPDEIIDLCDDDPQDDLTRQHVADEDEDSNVIFVSYIPPKPVSDYIETALVNDLEDAQKMVKSQNNVKDQVVGSQDIGTSQDMAGCQVGVTSQEFKISQESITGQGRETSKSNTTSLGVEESHGKATGMEIENIQGNASNQELNNSQYCATTQEIENLQGDITDQESNATGLEIENIQGNASNQELNNSQYCATTQEIENFQGDITDQESNATGLEIENIQGNAINQELDNSQYCATTQEIENFQGDITDQESNATGLEIENIQGNASNQELNNSQYCATTQEIENLQGDITDQESNATGLEIENIQGNASNQELNNSQYCATTQEIENFQGDITDQESNATGLEIENIQGNAINQELDNSQYYATTQEIENFQGDITDQESNATGLEIENIQGNVTNQELDNSQYCATTQEIENFQSDITDQESNATGMEIENIQGNATNQELDNSQYCATTQEIENFQGDITDQESNETGMEIENIHGIACLQTDMGTQEQLQGSADPIPEHRTSVFDQTSQQTCDQLQKHVFGITSDVRICLERIDVTIAKRTLDGLHKLIQKSKIKNEEHKETQVSPKRNNDGCLKDPKRQRIENIQTAPEDSENTGKSHISPSPQLEETLYDAEAEDTFGYEDLTANELVPTTDEKQIPAICLSDPNPAQICTQSSNSSAPSVQPHANTETMDCVLEACSAGSNNRKPKPGRRRGKGKRCLMCPHGVTGKAIRSSSTAQEEPGFTTPPRNSANAIGESSNQNKERSIKSQKKDKEPTSVEIQCPSTMREQGSGTPGEILASDPFFTAPMDREEIKRHERIKRLKELLKEKETALEMIRKNMG